MGRGRQQRRREAAITTALAPQGSAASYLRLAGGAAAREPAKADALPVLEDSAGEHIHWTGSKSRLNRDLKSRFDKEAYAFEELVAELGAAMTCALLQVQGELRHASYVQSWLKVLKDDPRHILTAASLTSKATDYLRALSERKEKARSATIEILRLAIPNLAQLRGFFLRRTRV